MKLIQLKIAGFRCFKNETIVSLDDLTLFIGKNDAGKSSLFDAMDIFFNDLALERGDVCVYNRDDKIKITCVFDNLPESMIIDEQYPTDLKSEYLLNENGRLEIVKCFNCAGSGKIKAPSVFAMALHPTTNKYDDLLTLTNAKLKQRAKELNVNLESVNQTINTEIRRAIWAQASDLKCKLIELELKTETAEKIWEQLNRFLPVFALFKSDRASTDQDAEAQDPMKAAIKAVIKEQESQLKNISDVVKKQLQEIADRTVSKIQEMSPDLAKELTPQVVNKSWDSLFSVSLVGEEGIPINKRGSGTRRLVLLNFFRAQAEHNADGKGVNIIYAIEEPETSQHPNNQKMMIDVFEDLACRKGCQVLLTTHTPTLTRRFPQSCIRYVTKKSDQPFISDVSNDNVSEIVNSLGVLPDHNIKVFFGVEGKNDIEFFRNISKVLYEAGEKVPDLAAEEKNGSLVFVPLGGSSLELWLSKLSGLNRPEFYLVDRDDVPPKEPKYQKHVDEWNKRPNCVALITNKKELENYIHHDLIKKELPNYAGTGDPFEDVPMLYARAVHESSESDSLWGDVLQNTKKLEKKESSAKRRLCTEFVSKMNKEKLLEVDKDNQIITLLRTIGEKLNSN